MPNKLYTSVFQSNSPPLLSMNLTISEEEKQNVPDKIITQKSQIDDSVHMSLVIANFIVHIEEV